MEPKPLRAQPLVAGQTRTTSWEEARDRLVAPKPEEFSHGWLATVRPDGRPHLMPIIPFWIDGAFHFIAGEGTRKGRNLAANARCAIGVENRRLPSLDIVVEGRAEPVSDPEAVRRLAEQLSATGWPLEARGADLYGPHTGTAGPPPYRIYRVETEHAFGLPGNYKMFEFEMDELPKPTRWDFSQD
jgi:nitroimidazol reductase NimA-like FMN-containing flavoprotein (pyridoxamine 5'-phosphate oxidase superfamily)